MLIDSTSFTGSEKAECRKGCFESKVPEGRGVGNLAYVVGLGHAKFISCM